MASLHEPSAEVVASGTLPSSAAERWGPRPGSATFSSSSPGKAMPVATAPALAARRLSVPPSPFASVADQAHVPDVSSYQQQPQLQHGMLMGLVPRPQSASFSSAVPDAEPEQHVSAQAAADATQNALLDEQQGPAGPVAATAAETHPMASVSTQQSPADPPLAASCLADGDAEGPTTRPASAFAPMAEAAPPPDWQAGARSGQKPAPEDEPYDEPLVQNPRFCGEPGDAYAQVSTCCLLLNIQHVVWQYPETMSYAARQDDSYLIR